MNGDFAFAIIGIITGLAGLFALNTLNPGGIVMTLAALTFGIMSVIFLFSAARSK